MIIAPMMISKFTFWLCLLIAFILGMQIVRLGYMLSRYRDEKEN